MNLKRSPAASSSALPMLTRPILPILALALLAATASCVQRQPDSSPAEARPGAEGQTRADSGVAGPSKAAIGVGEVVTGAGDEFRSVYQSSDHTLWFGSHGQGLFRVRGGVTTRFTSEHGLAGDNIRGIAEDRAGNIITVSEPGGISKFDGRTFRVLQPEPSSHEWRLHPDDLWFSCGTDTGAVFRYDGATLHRLTLPRTPAGDSWLAQYPREQFPGIKYSPYDVYTIYTDRRGHVWFGTALLGACRYDGASFEWIGEEAGFRDTNSFGLRSIIEWKPGVFWFCHPGVAFEIPPVGEGQRSAGGMRYRKVSGVGKSSDGFSTFTASTKAANGDLWLLVLGGGVWKYDGTRMTHYPVVRDGEPIWANFIYSDRQGGMWVGTNEHGVYRLNGAEFQPWRP